VTRLLPFFVIFLLAPLVGAADQKPVLSLVIDDLGYSYKQGKAALNLGSDHTYAIIPGTVYGKRLASLAYKNNREIILHLPLQASSKLAAAESNTLTESMNENQITLNTVAMLSEFPNIKGINNHMGSHLTAIGYFMRPIMESIKAYRSHLYFLDSLTTSGSVAHIEAINSGLDSVKRDVFLDNEHKNPESIKLQFDLWLNKARNTGSAVAIGHPHPETITFLTENLPLFEKSFRFMRLSELISAAKSASRSLEPQAYLTNFE
jgi:polysaccharide deacetylase 2 family uncharacterized protein YibQ